LQIEINENEFLFNKEKIDLDAITEKNLLYKIYWNGFLEHSDNGTLFKDKEVYLIESHIHTSVSMYNFLMGCISNPSILIGVDLPGLSAVSAFKRTFSSTYTIYDTHEFNAGDCRDNPEISEVVVKLEKALISPIDLCITVSDELADLLSNLYNKKFDVIPNYSLKEQIGPDSKKGSDHRITEFLIKGNAHPEREFEKFIFSWAHTNKNAILNFRCPSNEYLEKLKAYAKKSKARNRIRFSNPVSQSELISAASSSDIGIIPYDGSVHIGYKYCCPNKLSEYMAAGLAIVHFNINYVSRKCQEFGIGFEINWENFSDQINDICKNQELYQSME